MKKGFLFGWLLIPVLMLSGQIPLKDQPVKGEWNFKPEKVWEISKAGDEDFGQIGELLVSDAGRVFVRDFKKNISYIFDENGRFLKAFAPQGKEAGQLPYYLNRFQAGEKIVLAAPDKLHFFSQDGVFERTVDNNLFLRFPLRFPNENEFIYAPNFPQSPVQEKKLVLVDLASGKENILADFADPGEGKPGPGAMLMIPSLTPQVRLACDGNIMAFGRTDRYTLFLAVASGKIASSFSLNRPNGTASLEDRQRLVEETSIPKERQDAIVRMLPNTLTAFSHVEAVHGLICVYAVAGTASVIGSQKIDMFSEKGDYLYSGTIAFGEGLKFNSPANLLLKGDFLYVVLVDGQGRQTLAKFKIAWPSKENR